MLNREFECTIQGKIKTEDSQLSYKNAFTFGKARGLEDNV